MTSRLHQGRARHSGRAVLSLTPPLSRSRRAGGCAPCLIAFLLLFAWQKVCAQLAPAEDFFNSGAQLYISNNVPAALERVEMGLKTHPDDEKLKKLEQLLKQQQQQQQDQKDQQQKQDKDQKPQPKDQEKKSDHQKQDEQNQPDQKQDEEQKPPEQKKDSGDQPKDEKPEPPPAQPPVKPGEMTPDEAKRLLDAQKGNEQLLQLKPEGKPRNPLRPVKDW
jgi:outer membrane biosynthesis protein TonB